MNILKLFRRPKALLEKADRECFEVILSGAGGQGIILAGRILAEAASIYDGKEAVMTQSYGPEARGGASRAEVVISNARIDYPKVIQADILLAMTRQALDKYAKCLAPKGLLVVDTAFIDYVPSQCKQVFEAPFSSLAVKLINAPITSNIIALGALAAITNVVSREALIRAVLERVSKKVLVLDRISVDTGYKVVKDSGFIWNR